MSALHERYEETDILNSSVQTAIFESYTYKFGIYYI
jgi:hypothetical protein